MTDKPPTGRRVSVAEAADILGITIEAVRGRIKRGTIMHERDGERVYVILGADQLAAGRDQVTDQAAGQSPELVEELRDRLRFVERQLEAERTAHGEARRLLAAALERIPPQLEAPSEAPGGPETATDEPGKGESRADTEEPSHRRGFWSRLFGGGA